MAFVSPSLFATIPPSTSNTSSSSSAFGGKEPSSSRTLRLPSLSQYHQPSSRPQPPTCLFGGFFQEDKEERSYRAYDFSTASQPASGTAPNHAEYSAHIVGVRNVSSDGHHFELTIDVAEFELGEKHASPGQFIQIAVGTGSKRQMAYLTLSSPPGGLRDGSVQVLFTAKADPLNLHKMEPGKQLYVSLPMGSGMNHESVTTSKGDLFLFTDSVQGYSAAKSLVEWDYFRAVSGNGANRTNHVVIYYALPSRNSLPYPERLSSWSVFGVNVHPLPGISIMEHMSNPTPLGRPRHNLSEDHAFALLASMDTYEALFCALLLLGFRRTAVHKQTPETIQKEVLISAEGFTSQKHAKRHNYTSYDAREAVEEEIWRNWVNVRESMRAEFERKWSAKSRMEREQFADFKSKSQAWESWFAHNNNQWDQMAWDQEQWGKYWSSWKGSSGGSGSESSSSSSSSSNGYQWSQQNSKEYWDWVGRGQRNTRNQNNSNSGSSGSSGAWDHYGGEDFYGGSGGSWGSGGKSGYQKRGYRYNYEETEEDKKSNNNNWWSRKSRKSSSNSNSSGRNKNQWGNWSSRGRNERSSGSSGRESVLRDFGELDFYAVLGINSGASRADIKKAYRKKAMEHHPDLNPNQREAETKMKQIVVAWSILKDEGKRQKYDRYGASGGGF